MNTALSLLLVALSTIQINNCQGEEIARGEVLVRGGVLLVTSFDRVCVLDVDWGRITPPEQRGDVWYFDLPTRWWSEVMVKGHGPHYNPRSDTSIGPNRNNDPLKRRPGGQFEFRFL